MKQNKNESILCIGEFLVFIASVFLLFNHGFLNNIMRLSIAGAIAILFILLSDSFNKVYASKKSSKLSWLLGIILIVLVYYTAGSLNMLGPYLSLEGSNGPIFKATIAILVFVLSYLSSLKQHSKTYLLIVYAAMLILIYYAGLSIGLNLGYIYVILTSTLMLINIIKREGDLLSFSKYMSFIMFFYSTYIFSSLEIIPSSLVNNIIPLSLLCLVNLLNILILGYKDKKSLFNKGYLVFLIITIYRLLLVINSYEYNVFLIAVLSFTDFIYSYLNKEDNITNTGVKIVYNALYLYVLFNLQILNLLPVSVICLTILISSLGSIILKNHNKLEGYIFPVKLVITTSLILTSLNGNYLKIYPIIISLVINLVLIIAYMLIKKEPLKKELIILLIVNLFLPIFNTSLSILEYILALVIVFVDYYIIVMKHDYSGIKKVLINIAFIVINLLLVNKLDVSNIKYVFMAIMMLIIVASSQDNELLLVVSLLAFIYCGISYINGLELGFLGFALKEIVLICGIYIILKYIIKEKVEMNTWFIILTDLVVVYNLIYDKYYLFPLAITFIIIIYGLLKDKKLYNSVLILFLISCYLTFDFYNISGYVFLFVLGSLFIIYAMFNKEQVDYLKNMVDEALEDKSIQEVEIIEKSETPRTYKKSEASYCANCGNIMAGSDHFCRYCGYEKKGD